VILRFCCAEGSLNLKIPTSQNLKILNQTSSHQPSDIHMNLSRIYYLHEIGGKKNQEDYIWPTPGTAVPENKIFIVCDGVGGSDNGEVASRMIAEYTGTILLQTPPEHISLDFINDLLEAAKQKLVAKALAEGLNKDMATTFSLLVLFSNKAFIAWCGDSRVYHIRNGEILYKTSDHSLVNTLVKNGDISEEDALIHPQKNIILKAITADSTSSEADGQWIHDLAGGDYFMLCTDGLIENITDNDLKILLAGNTAADTDIVLAIQEKCFGKTRDNYSMYLLQVNTQATPVLQKARNRLVMIWVVVLVLAVVAAGLLYFNKKNMANAVAPADKPGSVIAPATNGAKDSLDTGKSSPDSAITNKEDSEEKKIMPAPLPETKTVADSTGHKKILRTRAADSVYVNPQTLIKNSHAAQKTDSLSKH
jgi:PPM family protein phosphatase